MKNKQKVYEDYVGVFILAVLPKIWLAMQTFPLKTFSDEVATVASAAALAGNDWSAVVSQAGYYGAGFYWIFAPVFMLTDNPVIIYRCILVGCSLIQALIAPICYYMLKHYFNVENQPYRVLVSVACAFLVMTRATILFNEHILILLVWLSVLIIAKLHEHRDNTGKKRLYTFLLMLVFSYGLTIHTRMLTLWLALAVLVVAYAIVYRCFLLSKLTLLIAGFGGYAVSGKIVDFVQGILWQTEEGGSLRNASVYLGLNYDFTSLRTWKAWISIIIGQIEMINLMTGGLVIILLVSFVIFAIKWIQKKYRNEEDASEDIYHVMIILFCLCCTVMTIGAQSLNWLGGAAEGISHGYNSSDYGLKAYTYLRYFGLYTGPLLMSGLVMLLKYKKENQKVVLLAAPISLVFFIAWMVLIQPFIFENRNTSEFFIGLSLYWPGDKVELRHYLIGIIFMLFMGVLMYRLLWQHRCIKIVAILAVYLLAQYYLDGMGYEVNRQKRNVAQASGAYEVVKEIEGEIELPEQIYCYDGVKKSDHYLFYLYQFYLNRYEIQPATPETVSEISTGKIIFSNKEDEEILLEKGYTCFTIDSNECVYIDDLNPRLYGYFSSR